MRHYTNNFVIATQLLLVTSLYHMRLVWRAIGGAEENSSCRGVRLLEAACATALHYADLVHGALADQGYYENHGE